MTRPAIVTYDGLPASAGGAHSLRTRRPSAAHAQVQSFLDACTRTEQPPALRFQLWAGGDDARAGQWEEFARGLLGGPRNSARTHREWSVRDEHAGAILGALDEAGADDVTRYGRSLAVLIVTAPTRLVDPDAGEPYPGVAAADTARFAVDGYGRVLGDSGIRAAIGTTSSSLSLWLAFPADDRLGPAALHVQAHAPVRLSTKHWRRWEPMRTGDGYRSTRIPSPLSA
ncbi:hypothetical protein [Leucobacter sp.]